MGFLLLPLENLSGDVAGLVRLGPVDFRADVGLMPRGRAGVAAAPLQDVGTHTLGFIDLDGARMRFLLGNPYSRESVQNFPALNFQLSR